RLLEPEPYVYLAVHRRRGGEVLARLLALARACEHLPEAEVAVGDERAHAARLGEGQCLAVVVSPRSASNRSGWVAMSPSRGRVPRSGHIRSPGGDEDEGDAVHLSCRLSPRGERRAEETPRDRGHEWTTR